MSFKRLRRVAAAAAAAIALLAAGTAPAVAAPPQPSWYYALGDSVAAGVGGTTIIDDGTSCLRTLESYPSVLGAKKNLACSGATTVDVLKQAQKLPPNVGFVSVTVGANDLEVGAITQTCLTGTPEACAAAVLAAQSELPDVYAGIIRIVEAIRAKSPDAVIAVTGYPLLFPQGLSPITDLVNEATDALNDTIAAAAAASGAVYVDVTDDFALHFLDSPFGSWINGPDAGFAAFHPNAAGYRFGYAPAVAAALGLPAVVLAG